MVEAVVTFGLQKLWELLSRESERLHGVDEQVDELKRHLGTLHSLLEDADAKKHESKRVRNFLEDVKDIVYDAEDIIETFLLKEESGNEKGIRKRVKRLACFLVERKKIASDIEGVTMRISEVIESMQSFGIQQIINGDRSLSLQERQREQREIRQTFPNNSESNLVAVEKSVEELVGHLVNSNNIRVVSVTGMGGIGKTTLARQVYHHDMVRHHFDGLAWVCVSQEFTQKHIWQRILQDLRQHDGDISHMDEHTLQSKLFHLLETNKYLIVLDDVWKEEDWDRVKAVFPRTKGWKMLLTSRNEGVGLHVDPTCFTFKPRILTPEESWKLCQSIVFPRRDETANEDSRIQSVPGLGSLPLLRVLDLTGVMFEGAKLPSSIGELIHLRLLNLYEAWVCHLPSSLQNLKLLIYLNLYVDYPGPVHVPNVLKEMQELRYLFLPLSMNDKTKLELRDLVNLESLWFFSTKHYSVSDLFCMTRLRFLNVYFTGGCTSETISSSLRELTDLETFCLFDGQEIRLADHGGELVLDFIHLKDLVLASSMPRFSDQYRFPPHLAHITLMYCRMKVDPMPILEKLLHLKSIAFKSGAFVGRRMVCSKGGFPQLCELVLSEQVELEEWKVEEGSMPCLRILTINDCRKLELPYGIKYITSLKELIIEGMKREWKQKLVAGGEDYYKVQHIPSVQFINCEDE